MIDNQKTSLPSASGGNATQQVDESRRRLTKAGVALPAVLATLASRPVFANACSISGMASGNASPQPGQLPCAGCTPGFWQANAINRGASWWRIYTPTDEFNTVFGVEDYKHCDGSGPLTLLEVLKMQGNEDPRCPNVGRQAIAALLNAASFAEAGYDYGYTPQDIINMFKARSFNNCEGLKDDLDMLNNRDCPLGNNAQLQDDSTICCKGIVKPPKPPKPPRK
jgi:hypothetical protein